MDKPTRRRGTDPLRPTRAEQRAARRAERLRAKLDAADSPAGLAAIAYDQTRIAISELPADQQDRAWADLSQVFATLRNQLNGEATTP